MVCLIYKLTKPFYLNGYYWLQVEVDRQYLDNPSVHLICFECVVPRARSSVVAACVTVVSWIAVPISVVRTQSASNLSALSGPYS